MSDAELKIYMRKYRETHKERLTEYGRNWWKKNGWKQNAIRRGMYRNNPAYREAELIRKRRERENG